MSACVSSPETIVGYRCVKDAVYKAWKFVRAFYSFEESLKYFWKLIAISVPIRTATHGTSGAIRSKLYTDDNIIPPKLPAAAPPSPAPMREVSGTLGFPKRA